MNVISAVALSCWEVSFSFWTSFSLTSLHHFWIWIIVNVLVQYMKTHCQFFKILFCCPRYTFYDGPPFATGLPHYGHILAGTIKDVVTRFAHQSGFHVDRRFGWDCHGLPVVRVCPSWISVHFTESCVKMCRSIYLNVQCPVCFCRSMRLIRLWGSKGLKMWPRWASPSTTTSAGRLSWDTPASGRWACTGNSQSQT